MARWGRSGNRAVKPSTKTPLRPTRTGGKGNRRKLSLIIITLILNMLLWGSLICIAASLYQIISDPMDASSYAQVALTVTSALATIGYTFFHTILSIKQRLQEQQQQHTLTTKRTSSVPTHLVGYLCVLWLVTFGWNMILVARRPVCLQMAAGLYSWEYGFTCLISRAGMTFAALLLGASIALLGILAKVSRPFEAHLLNHGYQPSTEANSPLNVPEMSHLEIASHHFQEHLESQRRSRSSYEATISNLSNVDANRILPNNHRPPSSPSGPFTVQSPRTGVFTSQHAPPPIPAAYITPRRNSLPGTFLSAPQPLTGHNTAASTSRCSDYSGNKRQSLPAPLSPSAWQVVHPNPGSLALVTHSRSDVPNSRLSYQNPYSRSSISLTRPQRLSYASAAPSVSSRTEHTDSDSQDESFSRTNSSEIARAFSKAIPVPMATHPSNRHGNIHLITALDGMSSDRQSYHIPHTAAPSTIQPDHNGLDDKYDTSGKRYKGADTSPDYHRNYVRSTSPGFLGLFSPDSSPTDDKHHRSPLKETSGNRIPRKPVPPPRGPSERASIPSKLMAAEAAAVMLSNMPDDLPIPEHHTRPPHRASNRLPSARRVHVSRTSRVYEQVKNKPLPRIAFL